MSPKTTYLLKQFETLPPERQQQVLDFIEFLLMRSRTSALQSPTARDLIANPQAHP